MAVNLFHGKSGRKQKHQIPSSLAFSPKSSRIIHGNRKKFAINSSKYDELICVQLPDTHHRLCFGRKKGKLSNDSDSKRYLASIEWGCYPQHVWFQISPFESS
jgi:hypothetical protein